MRLSRLELYGFKTFADATDLHLGEGITAVIGPNGSGKSNLADALLWVLAERRLTLLRAADSTDVIFAGSHARRPLGYAEVTLTVDNADRALPIDFAEVRVTRRLYRNGDNEYRLNGRRCRRKDIVDLFLDTGIGREAFTVISQREVDAILSLEPADRRRLLEEVAGVERYRSRRDETQHRLEETRANLTRLGDLAVGLEMQLGPLAEQRERALEFIELRDRSRRLRLSLQVKEYQLAERRVQRGDEEQATLRAAVEAARTDLAKAEAAEQQARLEQLRIDEQHAAVSAQLAETTQAAERHEARLQVAAERLRHLTDRLRDVAAELERRRDGERRLKAELETSQAELRRVDADLAESAAAIETRREVAGRLREAERALTESLRQRRSEATRAAGELAARTSAVSAGEAAADRAERRVREVETRRANVAERQRAAAERLTAAATARDQAGAGNSAASAEHARLSGELADLEPRRAEARRALSEIGAALAAAAARLEVLRAADSQLEGFPSAVRAVLEAAARGELAGTFTPLADLLDVVPGWEQAVEAALGPLLGALVCDTNRHAAAAVAMLAERRLGRALFLPLDRARPRPDQPAGPLTAQVAVDPRYRTLVEALLGGLAAVDDRDAVLDSAGPAAGRDGTVAGLQGAVQGGRAAQVQVGLLERRRQRADLEVEVVQLQVRRDAAAAEEAALGTAEQSLRQALREATATVEQQRRGLAAAERDRVAAEAALKQAEGEAGRLDDDLRAAAEELDAARGRWTQAQAGLAELGDQHRAAAGAVGDDEASLDRHRTERAVAEEQLAQLQVTRARAESRRQALAETAGRLDRSLTAAAEEFARLRHQQATWADEQTRLEAELEELRRERDEQTHAADQRREAHRALQAARADAMESVKAATTSARAARDALAEAQAAGHRADLRRMQLDAELQHLRQRIAEDHAGLTPEAAAELAEPIANRAEAAAELDELRTRMADLGEVNLGAIDEHTRITQQLAFFEAQRGDLEQAGADLQAVIDEIDGVTRDRLREAFVAVQREFEGLFVRVFGPGGAAELRWTDPSDPLASGLEVEVTLPGKRRQSIVLLSGGERAMTTVALLLAMFAVKPSPFCLLDELDAPLDDSNIRKYGELLRDFAQRSQFVIITHNPQTTRAADTLYGVTMQEPGVSRVLSQRPPADDETRDEAAG